MQNPETGDSRTREWLLAFFEAYASPTDDKPSFHDSLIGATPMPLEALYLNKSTRKIKNFIGRASTQPVEGNNDEHKWCLLADVSQAFNTLYPKQQRVLRLRYWFDLELNEIADRMECSDPEVCELLSSAFDSMAFYLDN